MSPLGCSSSPLCSNSSSKSYRQGLRGPASFLQHLFLLLSPQRGFLLVLLCLSLLSIFANEAVAQTVTVPATQTVAEPATHGTVTVTFTGDPNNADNDWAVPAIGSGGTADGRQNNGSISCQAGDDFVVHQTDDAMHVRSGHSSHTTTLTICADTVDEPDETFIISWSLQGYNLFDSNASNCSHNFLCTTTFTITDDDPTEVSLARVGSGAVTEGDKIEFTVTLGRALVAGEIIDVPLSISGTNVSTGDWSLALKSGATNTGVARRIGSVVRFSGAGAQTATLELTATDDNTADNNETFNIALGSNTDFDDASLDTNVGGGADPHSSNNAFSVTVNEPPPDVSLYPADAIGREGGTGTASVKLRLRRALTSGETLTVTYSIDLNTGVSESHNGVMLSQSQGSTSTGTLTITGPNAPKNIQLSLSPANNTVWNAGVRTREFKLTGVSGVAGASLSGVTSAKVFVNDRNFTRTTYMSAWRREVEEGGELIVMLHGKAGRKISLGPRSHRYHGYNATVGVQNLTTDFNDLGEGYAGHDAFGGYLRREGDTDYYNVAALGSGRSAELVIPITSDGTREGDERFRVFIVDTDRTYMGVRGTYNSLYSAPGIDFTIKGQSGGPQQSPSQQPEPPPVPTQAVSNIQMTALDADNAKVTWDEVEHATGYELEWEGSGSSVNIAGIDIDITGTTYTIDHYAPEPMTLTITVIPQYIDENGDTQQLNDLSGTAVFDVGGGSQSSDDQDSIQSQDTIQSQDDNNQQLEENCDLDEVQSDVENYVLETYNGDAHVARWQRVLNAFAGNDGGMSGVEARFMATLFSANRWEPVAEGIECLEAARGKDNTYAELIAKMYEWRYDTRWVSYKSHTNRWDRALLAFGESVSDSSLEPMTAADAQVFADRGWSRWVEVAEALWEIE